MHRYARAHKQTHVHTCVHAPIPLPDGQVGAYHPFLQLEGQTRGGDVNDPRSHSWEAAGQVCGMLPQKSTQGPRGSGKPSPAVSDRIPGEDQAQACVTDPRPGAEGPLLHPSPAARSSVGTAILHGLRRTGMPLGDQPTYACLWDPPMPSAGQPWNMTGHHRCPKVGTPVSTSQDQRGSGTNLCPPAAPLRGKPQRGNREGLPSPPPAQGLTEEDSPQTTMT